MVTGSINQGLRLLEIFQPGEFDWSAREQSAITYAFFIGYLISQIPGGFLAERYSVTWVLAGGVGLTGLFTCLTSFAARHSLYTFIFLRVLEGLGEVRSMFHDFSHCP